MQILAMITVVDQRLIPATRPHCKQPPLLGTRLLGIPTSLFCVDVAYFVRLTAASSSLGKVQAELTSLNRSVSDPMRHTV